MGSCFILQLLLFDEIGVDPDVGQTDGGVETEEDDKRNADVRDDVPGQHAVVFRMQLDGFGFLHLERVDDPQWQVAQEQEGHQGAPGFLGHVVLMLRAPAQSVQDEDGLDGGLQERESRRAERQDRQQAVVDQIRHRGHDEKRVERTEPEQRDDQETSVERAFLRRNELQRL